MTLYYSERTLREEVIQLLKRQFTRKEIESNYFRITRADTIDYTLFLRYFDCAVAKENNLYKAAISLPSDLEGRIPFWVVKTDGEFWINPESGLRGKNFYEEDRFIVKFYLYVDEKNVHKLPETRELSTEKALVEEFTEIRHALINGNEEPIEIFKSFYKTGEVKTPVSHTGKYLASILAAPH